MRRQGRPPCQPGTGSVTKYSCSTGTIGSSRPASRASAADHGPGRDDHLLGAVPAGPVETERTAPPAISIAVTGACVDDRDAEVPGRADVRGDQAVRLQVAVGRRPQGGLDRVGPLQHRIDARAAARRSGTRPAGRSPRPSPRSAAVPGTDARTARAGPHRTRGSPSGSRCPARTCGRSRPRPSSAGRARPSAWPGPTNPAAWLLVASHRPPPLEQLDVAAALAGQEVGDRGADRAAADDRDLGVTRAGHRPCHAGSGLLTARLLVCPNLTRGCRSTWPRAR